MLTTRMNSLIHSKEICKGCLLELNEFICNTVASRRIVIVMAAQVVNGAIPRVGAPKNIDKLESCVILVEYCFKFRQI